MKFTIRKRKKKKEKKEKNVLKRTRTARKGRHTQKDKKDADRQTEIKKKGEKYSLSNTLFGKRYSKKNRKHMPNNKIYRKR